MCNDFPNPCKNNSMESEEGGIDRRNTSIAKKAQDIISWRRLRKGWCMSSTWRRSEYYHSWKARDEARKEKKKLENSKSGRPTRCRERLQRKHLRPSIFSAHLDNDDGGGIRYVWGKKPPSRRWGWAEELRASINEEPRLETNDGGCDEGAA